MAIVTNPSMIDHQTMLAKLEVQLAGLVKLKCKFGTLEIKNWRSNFLN
jgi:hypothetical protein